MVKVKLKRAVAGGMETQLQAENALCCTGGWQLFFNLDPIYTAVVPDGADGQGGLHVCIEGEIERLGAEEAGRAVMEVMYEKRDMIYEYQGKVRAMEEKMKLWEQKNTELEMQNRQLYEKLQKLTNSSLRHKLAAKIRQMDRKKEM